MNTPGIVTLTTDFGLEDSYVGAMKGVILSINPSAKLVDITHLIPPQNVRQAALLLSRACPYFPQGTVHLAVVDPGVGTDRRAIALKSAGQIFVGPDNGLLTHFLTDEAKIVELSNPRYFLDSISKTFHGRDLFAPSAAHLSKGLELGELGKFLSDPILLEIPKPDFKAGQIEGHVISVDRFGNLVTNIPEEMLPESMEVVINDASIKGLKLTYAEAPEGELIAIIGSSGQLEISVVKGSAAERLGLSENDDVAVIVKE